MTVYYDSLATQCGDITVLANEEGICEVAFDQGGVAIEIKPEYIANNEHAPKHLSSAIMQLQEYFANQRESFDLPLALQGTPFQRTVWQALTKIKFGKTVSYGQLAGQINNPKAVRAVGTANGANKLAIIVPCHRVIGKDKKLTGYAGGIGIKAKLLMLEGAHFKV